LTWSLGWADAVDRYPRYWRGMPPEVVGQDRNPGLMPTASSWTSEARCAGSAPAQSV